MHDLPAKINLVWYVINNYCLKAHVDGCDMMRCDRYEDADTAACTHTHGSHLCSVFFLFAAAFCPVSTTFLCCLFLAALKSDA